MLVQDLLEAFDPQIEAVVYSMDMEVLFSGTIDRFARMNKLFGLSVYDFIPYKDKLTVIIQTMDNFIAYMDDETSIMTQPMSLKKLLEKGALRGYSQFVVTTETGMGAAKTSDTESYKSFDDLYRCRDEFEEYFVDKVERLSTQVAYIKIFRNKALEV